jgi:hypothetical protein
MKKLLLLLLLLPALTFSQGVVGLTVHELKDAFPENSFTNDYMDEGVLYVTDFNCSKFAYFVRNGTDVVEFSICFPTTDRCVSLFIEKFNREYVIISENKWKAYLDGSVLDITLEYNDKGYYTITYQ